MAKVSNQLGVLSNIHFSSTLYFIRTQVLRRWHKIRDILQNCNYIWRFFKYSFHLFRIGFSTFQLIIPFINHLKDRWYEIWFTWWKSPSKIRGISAIHVTQTIITINNLLPLITLWMMAQNMDHVQTTSIFSKFQSYKASFSSF